MHTQVLQLVRKQALLHEELASAREQERATSALMQSMEAAGRSAAAAAPAAAPLDGRMSAEGTPAPGEEPASPTPTPVIYMCALGWGSLTCTLQS